MPNWCENKVTITGDNLEHLIEVIKKDNGEFISESFIQIPKELLEKTDLTIRELIERFGFDNWRDWQEENIGTWDFGTEEKVRIERGYIEFYCETAWSPPIPFFKKISSMYNCEVDIKFAETGCWFSGRSVIKNGIYLLDEDFDGCFTECGLEAMNNDLYDFFKNEDMKEFLLDRTEEEKETILVSEIVCDEVKALLQGDAA